MSVCVRPSVCVFKCVYVFNCECVLKCVCLVKRVYVSFQNCMYVLKALQTELVGLLRKQKLTHMLFECRSELFKCCSDLFNCCSDLFT